MFTGGSLQTVPVKGGVQFVIQEGLTPKAAIVLDVEATRKMIANVCKMVGIPLTPIIVRTDG